MKVLHLLLEETAEQPEQNAIVQRRLIYQLIGTSTLPLGDQKDLIRPVRREARQERRRRLWRMPVGKLKIMALWAAAWPWSYCMVHKLYARIRGTDKKYEVK